MSVPLIQASWDGWRIPSLQTDGVLDIRPEPGHPRGQKGALMAAAWDHWREQGASGVIWMDPDIVADPDDLYEMLRWVIYRPDTVWCSLHKLYPASTGRDTWVWGHGRWAEPVPEMTQKADVMPGWFAMGMTYTPALLLDKVAADLPCWEFGSIDMGLSRAAREIPVPIRVADKCRPKHLHYLPRQGDPSWRA